MSGVDLDDRLIRKGAADSVRRWIEEQGGTVPSELGETVDSIAAQGGTPLVVAEAPSAGAGATPRRARSGSSTSRTSSSRASRERFEDLRRMGIKTVMITGDNPRTAAYIAKEAGVDDFLAEATPEDKMELIKREQAGGHLVAMTGDGTNDAPALAQADVAVAMNTGTQAAKEAGNMVDLDSDPTKLIDIVEIGKQLLITRGSLTTFSIANDVAKYFAIIPAMFAGFASVAVLDELNIMDLGSAALGDPLRGDLQRADHRGADPARAARRQVPAVERLRAPAAQHLHLRPRRDHRALHRHQAHRHRRLGTGSGVMRRQLMPALVMILLFTLLTGLVYGLAMTGFAQVVFPHKADGSIIEVNGKEVGSSSSGRPSSTRRATRSRSTSSRGPRRRRRTPTPATTRR